jgi:hypothetical protein
MVQLDLTKQELEIIIDVLENTHSDLRMEIADTDRKDFRDMLKVRKGVILKVLETLKAAAENTGRA